MASGIISKITSRSQILSIPSISSLPFPSLPTSFPSFISLLSSQFLLINSPGIWGRDPVKLSQEIFWNLTCVLGRSSAFWLLSFNTFANKRVTVNLHDHNGINVLVKGARWRVGPLNTPLKVALSPSEVEFMDCFGSLPDWLYGLLTLN